MQIKLNRLTLENFKGIKAFTIEPQGQNAVVRGRNAAGKTTLADGFLWLLFGKDTQGKANFAIKTLDSDGQEIHNLCHSVEAVLDINGSKPVTLKKTFKEKWTKKRGSAKKSFTGHTTDHFIDGVPVKEKEWNQKINALIDEDTFKLLTSPTYFNSLHGQKRREILLRVCGDVSDADVIESDKALRELPEILSSRSLDEHRKVVDARKKEINERLKEIPARIDELDKSLPDESANRNELQSAINILDARIEKAKDDSEVSEWRSQLADAKAFLSEKQEEQTRKEREANKGVEAEIDKLNAERRAISGDIADLESNLDLWERKTLHNDNRMIELREEFKQEQVKSPHTENTCPTCGQPLPQDQIDAATAKFNEQQARKLAAINTEGKDLKKTNEINEQEIKNGKAKLSSFQGTVAKLEKQITEAEAQKSKVTIPEDSGIKEMETEITRLEKLISEKPKPDTLSLELERKEKQAQIATLDAADKTRKRIEVLGEEEKDLVAEHERLEKETYLMERFIVRKSEILTEKINAMFKMVKWSLFESQINEGVKEVCYATVDGVPWDSVNDGNKLLGGLDIVETLQGHYGIKACVWVDHVECLSSPPPEMDCQMFLLSVSDDKELNVEYE